MQSPAVVTHKASSATSADQRNSKDELRCVLTLGDYFQYGQAVQREEGRPPFQGQIRMLNMQVSLWLSFFSILPSL
jgi:hypothetical protein